MDGLKTQSEPFLSFRVTPSWGTKNCVIEYKTQPDIEGSLYFFRSMTGKKPWTILNPDTPAAPGKGSFEDTTLSSEEWKDRPWYRALIDDGSDEEFWEYNDPVAPLAHLHPKQKNGAKAIISREFRSMSGPKGDGRKAFHLIAKEGGEPINRYDPETGQMQGRPCQDEGYGTPWKEGFYSPIATLVRVITYSPWQNKSSADMQEDDKKAAVNLRLLSFPRPGRGDLIVFPENDERYLIGSTIRPYFFPGTNVPIAWEVPGIYVKKDDVRKKISVPEWKDPTSPPAAS